MPGRVKSSKSKPGKAAASFSLVSDESQVNPVLAGLFQSSSGPVKVPTREKPIKGLGSTKNDSSSAAPLQETLKQSKRKASKSKESPDSDQDSEEDSQEEAEDDEDDEELSEGSEQFSDPSDEDLDEDLDDEVDDEDEDGEENSEVDDGDDEDGDEDEGVDSDKRNGTKDKASVVTNGTPSDKRKRKRNLEDDNLEGVYFEKLAREEERDAKKSKRPKKDVAPVQHESDGAESDRDGQDASDDPVIDVPVHETLAPSKDDQEVEKASRTVFLANVSTTAITSKSAKKTLLSHLASFIPHLDSDSSKKPAKSSTTKHTVESIRFRSTAFSSSIPKKAAFAKGETMDETTKSTNAYAVYSTKLAAREAVSRLNGTVVLGRHLRVDSVAHPSATDHRRCVFVGNLGFVDDETNMRAVEKAQGDNAVRKPQNGDVEEGLWIQFSKAGKVENVRVVRDSKTRVGKGIAYVQFADQNGVEAALQFDGKKYPPLLPRKLRVSRAKKNTGPKPTDGPKNETRNGKQRKIDPNRQSLQGRAAKLLGRAGAANVKSSAAADGLPRKTLAASRQLIKAPESFVFEGHRATKSQGNSGLRLGKGSGKKKDGRPRSRSAKRGAEWKKKKATTG